MAFAGTVLMVAGLSSLVWVAQGSSVPALCALVPVSVIGFSALTPSLQSMLSLSSTDSEQGGILGLGQSMSAMARILGPLTGVILFHEGRTPTWPYWFGSGLMVLGVLAVAALRTAGYRPDSATDPS